MARIVAKSVVVVAIGEVDEREEESSSNQIGKIGSIGYLIHPPNFTPLRTPLPRAAGC